MKKTLTVCLLALALAGAGQYPIYNRLPLDTTIAPKYDTIPIIYLYCDTVRMMIIGHSLDLKSDTFRMKKDTAYSAPNYNTYWGFGYEVITDGDFLGYVVEPMTGILKPVYARKSITYLDRQRRPIRKSIIVWNVKQIQ